MPAIPSAARDDLDDAPPGGAVFGREAVRQNGPSDRRPSQEMLVKMVCRPHMSIALAPSAANSASRRPCAVGCELRTRSGRPFWRRLHYLVTVAAVSMRMRLRGRGLRPQRLRETTLERIES